MYPNYLKGICVRKNKTQTKTKLTGSLSLQQAQEFAFVINS
jgi:predicted Kef-type K+ transport protein